MNRLLETVRRQISDFLSKKDKKQKWLLGILALVVLGGVVVAFVLLNRVQYEVLYTGLESAEAGKILSVLSEKGVKAKAQGSDTILIANSSADEVRMELAAEGYPESGLNYDLFSNASSFGTTDMEKKTYLQYQLQENLRSTILKLNGIKDCIVMINMPTDSLYVLSSDEQKASASVLLEVSGGQSLSNSQVKAIANLVLKSVPGLTLDNISIIDSGMNQYDVTGEDSDTVYTTSQYELTQKVKDTLTQQVMSVLTPVFGKDNVLATVNVSLDFDKQTVSSVEFAPPVEGEDGGLAVSMEELYQKTQGDGTATGTAGTDSNGVGVPEYMYESADAGDFSTISRTVNYELNQTQTEIEKQQGKIDDLSVAVLINSGAYSEDYSENVRNLVAMAIGVEDKFISVETLPFQISDDDSSVTDLFENQSSLANMLKNKDLLKTAIISATIIALFFLVLRFARSVVSYRVEKPVAVTSGGGTLNVLLEDDTGEIKSLADIESVEKTPGAEKIRKYIDKNPEAVAQLLRNWLTAEAR